MSVNHTRGGGDGSSRKIVTRNINPPIPMRQFDWRALIEGVEKTGRRGYGRTEAEAINNLVNNRLQEG
jgi:hypothetical protein